MGTKKKERKPSAGQRDVMLWTTW